MAERKSPVIHNINNVFITSKDKVNFRDIQKHLESKLHIFREDTKFVLVCGTHHEAQAKKDGSLGKTDMELISAFYYNFFGNLRNTCGKDDCQNCTKGKMITTPCKSSIWEQKRFKRQLIPIFTKVTTKPIDWIYLKGFINHLNFFLGEL